jgi:hypothetical protein
MGGTTDDRNDPGLNRVDPDTGLQDTYLVLSDEERAKGFVRPLRVTYIHERCGTATTMARPIAETYARNPHFYGGTYCAKCQDHFPVGPDGEFVWDRSREDTPLGETWKVGT